MGTEVCQSYTQNLRREARVDVRVPVVVLRGRNALALETSDVSFKGLFVCTSDPPALRSLVRLRVALIDRELEAHAMAVHVVNVVSGASPPNGDRAPGVGLQFWGLSGADRTAWDDFVRGVVQARRAAAKAKLAQIAAAEGFPPPSEATPSGIRVAVGPPSRS